jgi:hypothetical protein
MRVVGAHGVSSELSSGARRWDKGDERGTEKGDGHIRSHSPDSRQLSPPSRPFVPIRQTVSGHARIHRSYPL